MPKSPASKSSPKTRKQLSGAQKRKRAILKAAEQLAARSSYEADGVVVLSGARSSQQELTELPVYGVPPPKLVGVVEAALVQLEQGQFLAAAQLADGMLRDSHVYATLGVRVGGLVGAHVELEPALDTQRARRIQEDAEEVFSQMFPPAEVSELVRWGLLLGVGLAQVIYERDGKAWKPTIKVWHPKFLRFDWVERKYKLLTEGQGEITIEPDDAQWLVFEPYGPRGWLRCLMRAISMPWLIRAWVRSWWARYCEVHGQPIRLGIIPADRDAGDEKRFLQQLSSLAHEAVIRLPQGEEGNRFDVRLLEAQANTFQGFQALLQHCDDSIAIATLGQRSSTSGSSGLGSDANPGDSVRIDIKRSDAALVGAALRDQVLCQWAEYNYGVDLAPYIRYQVDPPEDLQKKAQELLTLMQALQIAPPELDKRAAMESFNLPLLDESEMPPDVPNTPDPKPQPPDDGPDGEDDEEPTDDPEDDEQPADATKLSAHIDRLSAAAKLGDRYTAALATKAKKMAAHALGPDLSKVRGIIEAATSTTDLRDRLKDAFGAMDPEHLADVTHKALVLASLAGRAAVHADTKAKR